MGAQVKAEGFLLGLRLSSLSSNFVFEVCRHCGLGCLFANLFLMSWFVSAGVQGFLGFAASFVLLS